MTKKTKLLCIFDGFGLTPKSSNNAIYLAKMSNFRKVLEKYWWTTLNADGEFVGQEAGLVGNSEVGHMNIGGLGLIRQLSYQITKSASQKFNTSEQSPDQLFDPKVFLKNRFNNPNSTKTIHLAGLFSTGTIHSDLRHWAGAIESAGIAGAEKIVLHLFSDGRDSDRQSLVETWDYFTDSFSNQLKPYEDIIFLGSLGGRFYAMDRDNNWDRIIYYIWDLFQNRTVKTSKYWERLSKISTINGEEFLDKFYNKYVKDQEAYWNKKGLAQEKRDIPYSKINFILNQITDSSYADAFFDETIPPKTFKYIQKNDTVWLLNYRTDRMKQFSKMLCDINEEFELNLDILGMNDYCVDKEIYLDSNLEITRQKSQTGYYPVFKNEPVKHPLAERISQLGKTQLHIAETEKYNHVTYFLNGGQNKKWDNEDWHVIDSNKVTSHAEKPEMKVAEITDYILENGLGKYDYIVVNFANPDMIGHTGSIEASIESLNVLDVEFGRLIEAVEKGGHKLILTADHGNIEVVGELLKGGKLQTDTEHNPNLVPCVIVDTEFNTEKLNHLISSTIEKYKLPASPAVISEMLSTSKNKLDLSDQNSWLSAEDIPKTQLPLWFSGLIFLSLE